MAVRGVRGAKMGAPMAARALAIVHTCMYDAWAPYDERAVGTQLRGALRRPASERTVANKGKAISYAAYRALSDVLPVDTESVYRPLMKQLGYDPDDHSTDIETPTGIGNVACAAVLEFRHHDKSNQLGDMAQGPYSDWSGYVPVNGPGTVPGRGPAVSPDHWQPLTYTDSTGSLVLQKFAGAQWCYVTPFALAKGEEFRSAVEPGPFKSGMHEYQQQAEDLIALSAGLTDRQKMTAEYWSDGPYTEQPPGHWARFAQFVSVRDQAPKIELTAVEPRMGASSPGTKTKVYGNGFTTDTAVYIGGLEAREVKFISPSVLEAVVPYVRPGSYKLQLKSGELSVRSDVTFTVTPSPVDSEVDRAVALAAEGRSSSAVTILTNISKINQDPQVRAFARYEIGQVYFDEGDLWRWAGETSGVFEPEAGAAVQTFWKYRLSYAQSVYYLPLSNDSETPLKLLNWAVTYDVTENPEPRFFRAIVNARYGNIDQAKADSDFTLSREPSNPSYRALAAYVNMLRGDTTTLESFRGEIAPDANALSLLGETAYLSGDSARARLWWDQAAKISPLRASLACWAGKKHLSLGQRRIAVSLLTECSIMAPDSTEAKEARELLAKM